MKIKWAKLVCAAMPAAMALCGCSSTTASTTATSSSSTAKIPASKTVKGEEDQQTYPISDSKITLTLWDPQGSSMGTLADRNDGEFFQWYEQKTNVHIDFTIPATGTEAEAFNLLFTSNKLPDILDIQTATQKYRDGMDAAINDGYLVNMVDYLNDAPNYCSWINNIDTAKKDVLTDSGKMYGMWGFWDNMKNGYADQGISIRQDFLKKVGMDVPTTYDEWEKVLTAFKDKLGIEAPFFTSKYGIDNGEFMAGYGIAPYFYQVDGTVKYGPLEDGYKDYLTMMADWYKKGLLDPDFDTRTCTGIAPDKDMILNDKVGACIDWGTRMTDAYISRGATNKDFWAVAAPQPKINSSDADPAWRAAANNYHSMQAECFAVSAASKNIEAAVRWLDGFYAKDVYLNANYGIDSEEGTVWTKASDGHRVGNFDFRYSNPNGLDSATVLVKYWTKNPPVRVEAAQIEQMPAERAAAYDVWSKYEPKNYIPTNISMTVDEGTDYAQAYTEIELYVQEMNVKFIKGTESLDNYDKYREQLKSMGIEDCIKIQQAALDRYNAR